MSLVKILNQLLRENLILCSEQHKLVQLGIDGNDQEGR